MSQSSAPRQRPGKLRFVKGESRNNWGDTEDALASATLPAVTTLVGIPTPSEAKVQPAVLSPSDSSAILRTSESAPDADAATATSTPHLPGSLPSPGDRVGPYEIIRQLGQGGKGAVYEASDIRLQRQVALKILDTKWVGRAEVARQVTLDLQVASHLKHPHVVEILDYCLDGTNPYLVMELLQGEPLSSVVRRGPMSPEAVADVFLGICAGIQAGHNAGIIHRDLKPSNLFLAVDENGETRPKVLDFGISKSSDWASDGLTHTGDITGTSHYLSPEQAAANRIVDARSDQYSLGVLIYEAVTQHTPHEGEQVYQLLRNLVEGKWLPPRIHCPDLAPDFEAIILRAMRLQPEERYPSVFFLGQALFPHASSLAQRQYDPWYKEKFELRAPTLVPELPTNPRPPSGDLPLTQTEILPALESPEWQLRLTRTASPRQAESQVSLEFESPYSLRPYGASRSDPKKPGIRWGRMGMVVVGLLACALGAYFLLERGRGSAPTDLPPKDPTKSKALAPSYIPVDVGTPSQDAIPLLQLKENARIDANAPHPGKKMTRVFAGPRSKHAAKANLGSLRRRQKLARSPVQTPSPQETLAVPSQTPPPPTKPIPPPMQLAPPPTHPPLQPPAKAPEAVREPIPQPW